MGQDAPLVSILYELSLISVMTFSCRTHSVMMMMMMIYILIIIIIIIIKIVFTTT